MPQETKLLATRVSPTLHEALRRHAFERNVSISVLSRDILACWVRAVTAEDDPLFKGVFGKLPEAPTGFPGYVESLGFGDV